MFIKGSCKTYGSNRTALDFTAYDEMADGCKGTPHHTPEYGTMIVNTSFTCAEMSALDPGGRIWGDIVYCNEA